MTRYRALICSALAALVVTAAACGDDAATTTLTSTTAATSTTATPTTTSTTTTTAPTTTIPGDAHPAWGYSWTGIWEGREAMTATYRTQIVGSDWMELPAHFEFGLDWRGGTWDRLVIGTVEPGQYGAALYFSRPEPWVLRLWGVEETSPDRDEAVLEYFEVPQDLDFTLLPEAPPSLEGNMLVALGEGTSEPAPAVYRMEWVGIEELEVPAGAFEDAIHVSFGLGGDFYPAGPGGEVTFHSDLWLHPEQLILKCDMGPAGGPLELAEPWHVAEGN